MVLVKGTERMMLSYLIGPVEDSREAWPLRTWPPLPPLPVTRTRPLPPQVMVPPAVDAVGAAAAVAVPGAMGEELIRRGKSFPGRGITPPPLAPGNGAIAPPKFTLTGICEETRLIIKFG